MAALPIRSCRSCSTPLPADAQFCPRCGTRTPTQISGGGTTIAVDSPTPDALAEQRERLQQALGTGYVVEHLLGSGGFAQVWAAYDKRLDRRVAVKVLHPELIASRALIERFQREAQAVAKLRHPGIVPIYGVGEHEGVAYYIMPLVEGVSLREALQAGPLPANEARRILRETAAALAVAHKAGIVHRDIKPENIMLDGEERRVLVMDFGIAKSTAVATTGLTGTGMIIGTPAYMSPEQATASKEIGPASDIYSLGVVGFEMVTGRTPFQADSVPELVMKQVAAPAPSLAAARPNVSDDLAVAVNRCLAKEVAERWRDAAELAAYLDQAVTPVRTDASKRIAWFARRGPSTFRRRLDTALLALIVVAAMALVTARPTWLRQAYAAWIEGTWGEPDEVNFRAPPGRVWPWLSVSAYPFGGSRIAVIDWRNSLAGLHVFDGSSWQTFRAPDLLRAATQQGNEVLLFSDTAMYRWTLSAIRYETGVPFQVATAWAGSGAIAVFGDNGEIAWRSRTGWTRQPNPRRGQFRLVGGDRHDRLYALGYFGVPDVFILTYDGVTWELLDPRAENAGLWSYASVVTLERGTVLLGGYDVRGTPTAPNAADTIGNQPLILERNGSSWSRIPLQGPANLRFPISGIWGVTRDSLIVWTSSIPDCRRPCVAEVVNDTMRPIPALSSGGVRSVVGRDPVYAIREDGTLWARHNGRWSYAAELPAARASFVSELGSNNGGWSWSHASAGLDLLNGEFRGDATLPDRVLSAPGLPVRSIRGLAVGRHEAWVLGADSAVYHIDCRRTSPCTVARVGNSQLATTALEQIPGGGAMELRGGSMIRVWTETKRRWELLRVFVGMESEPVLAIDARSDTTFVALGSNSVYDWTPATHARRLGELPPDLRGGVRFLAALSNGGAAVATERGVIAAFSPSGSVTRTIEMSPTERVASLLGLDSGLVAIAVSESSDDPYATGRVLVYPSDLDETQRIQLDVRSRSRTAIHTLWRHGNYLFAAGPGHSRLQWYYPDLLRAAGVATPQR